MIWRNSFWREIEQKRCQNHTDPRLKRGILTLIPRTFIVNYFFFSAIRILREINFAALWVCKIAIWMIFEVLNFPFWHISTIFDGWWFPKLKFIPLKIVQMVCFETQGMLKSISRKNLNGKKLHFLRFRHPLPQMKTQT